MRCSVVADAGAGADMSLIVESPLFLADEAATLAFAQRFAADVQPPCSIALVGDLGQERPPSFVACCVHWA